jgi:SPX domain protein involved in polyphosphate accumulation
MFKHHLQANRFELKYVISEACAAGVRNFLRSYLVPDEFNPPEGGGYQVNSVYLDSPNLELCNATVEGHKNRYKLRIRFYDDAPTSPVFYEIKRRVNDAILKERARVKRESCERLLAGHWPSHTDLVKFNPKSFDSLRTFCDLRSRIQARGQAIVTYEREAYVTPDSDSVRVTFDRNLRTVPFCGEFRAQARNDWSYPEIAGTVLELKFTERFPVWMRNMVRVFNLQRGSMPKYVECVNKLGVEAPRDRHFTRGGLR